MNNKIPDNFYEIGNLSMGNLCAAQALSHKSNRIVMDKQLNNYRLLFELTA